MIKKTLTTLLTIAAMIGLAQFAKAQTADGDAPSVESIEELIELTLPSHPWDSLTKPSAPATEDEASRQRQVKKLDDALAVNQELTPDQKLFVKAHYEDLRKIVGKQVAAVADSMFPFEQWAKESLEERFSDNLTEQEVAGLIAYFQTAGGQAALKVFKNAPHDQEIVKSGGTLPYTKAEEAEADRFGKTAVGKKFMEAFFGETKESIDAKMEEAKKSGGQKIQAILDPANLNKIFNQFVKENYKK